MCLVLQSPVAGRFDIRDFGAIADDDSLGAEESNASAIMDAFVAANYTLAVEDREVYIPANMTFHSFPVFTQYINHLTLTIDGTLKASKRNNLYPVIDGKVRHIIEMKSMQDLRIRGVGTVDG